MGILQKQDGPLTPNVDQLSGLRMPHRRYEKVYYLQNKAFWGEQGRFPKLVRKWLVRTSRGDWCWVSIVTRMWGCNEGSWGQGLSGFESSAGAKRRNTQALLLTCPDEGHKDRRRVKSCQLSNIKSRVRLLQQGSSGFHFIGAPGKHSIPLLLSET